MPEENTSSKRFIKFLLVGGLNTIFGYSVFALLIYLGIHYSIAVLISTFLGIIFNFKTVSKLVFNSHDDLLIFKFFAVYGIVYLFNVSGIRVFSALGVNNYASGAVLVLPAAVISYLLNKKFVFTRQ